MPWPWIEILAEIRELTDSFRRDGSVAWYRGHAEASWPLLSTLHRFVEDFMKQVTPLTDPDGRREMLRQENKRLYRRFKADAWPLLDIRERTDWGVVFAMQHYGQPTRLLDWTESLACAVYFAQFRRHRDRDAAIWVLDPQALNVASVGFDGLVALDDDYASEANISGANWHPKWLTPNEDLPSVAVSPVFTNPRMTAQRAAFTMSGDSFCSLDIEFPELVRKNKLRRFLLPAATFDDAEAFLASAGLDAFTFFPDLQGLKLRHDTEAKRRIADARRWYPQAFKSNDGDVG